ncbi:PTS transporter subunit EIIC [Pantoea sp. 1B4]|uniref:PTS transporter subunit EIIC n=1 Tax=Pantoea sp. 1B4 TaxID=2804760 RepID=UPI0031FD74A9
MKQLTSQIHAFGKALMMPISVIAAAGIFLGLAAAMQNPAVTGDAFAQMQVPQLIIGFIRKVAGALFANLPVFFAVASTIGLAKAEKPTAAFAAVIGYIVMNVGISATLAAKGITAATTTPAALQQAGMDQTTAMMTSAEYINMLGVFTYNMSVLGGVIAGLVTVALHNRFYTQQLPTAISFFGGRRFVPIVTVVCLPLIGVLLALIWPTIGDGIAWIGQMIGKSGQYGAFLLGAFERILIPTGLHHILNETVRFTPIGGMAVVDGQTVVGALNIFNASLTHPGSIPDETLRTATQFLAQGKIPVMMFGLPAAALAIYHTARPEHKQRVKALVMAGGADLLHHRHHRTAGVLLYLCLAGALSAARFPDRPVVYADVDAASDDWQRAGRCYRPGGVRHAGWSKNPLVVDAGAGRDLCADLLLRFPAGDHPDEC